MNNLNSEETYSTLQQNSGVSRELVWRPVRQLISWSNSDPEVQNQVRQLRALLKKNGVIKG
jgi:hypothetical protein